jgi:hypothetical protein
MKKLLLVLAVFAMAFNVNAQIETPQPSPFSKVEQKVGLTDVSIEYSRPNMRGRTIFGDLVPYGKLWRTGANKNTKITFSDDVTIDGKELKAGSYAIYVTPSVKSWEVVFYSDANNSGTPRVWDETKVAAKVTADVYPLPIKIETFTITFDDLASDSAVIGLMWSDVYVGVKFEVPTDKSVTASINKIMAGPGADDYYAAARYYLEADKDINQAAKWIDMAIDMTKDQPRFWWLRQQSLIHAKAGNKDKAIAAAKASMAGAKEAKNDDYVKMNMDSLKEWGAM